jgi:hypothetical protein
LTGLRVAEHTATSWLLLLALTTSEQRITCILGGVVLGVSEHAATAGVVTGPKSSETTRFGLGLILRGTKQASAASRRLGG